MIIDSLGLLSNKQAITASAASTNVIDTGTTKDIGPGNPVQVLFQVTEAFNNLTSLALAIQTATDEAFTSPITLVNQTVLLASLAVGYKANLVIPKGAKRYIRAYYTVTGTAPTTGKVYTAIVETAQMNG